MRLIFVHGRAQAGKDADALKSLWMNTFQEGLKKAGLVMPEDVEVLFPFYGNILEDLVSKLGRGRSDDAEVKGEGIEDRMAAFQKDFLFEMAQNAGISEEELYVETPVTEKGLMNMRMVRALLKLMDAKGIGSEQALKVFTRDVYAYLKIPAIASRINGVVHAALNNEPTVVVGHSLGSIVSYCVLSAMPGICVKKFITIGSPLGVRAVKDSLPLPLKMPPGVRDGWFNAYDARDIVALRPLDKDHFDIEPPVSNYEKCCNQTDNRHGIEGYLNDAVVAENIYDGLTGKSR